MNDVVQERRDDVVAISWNRPDAMNALTPAMLTTAGDMVTTAAADTSVRVIVLTGTGRAFSAGVDLKALGSITLRGGSVGDVLDIPARRLIRAIETAPQPVIAQVNGHCFTGALEIALACDLLVMAEEASLGDTHAKWGLRPTWGMSQRLPRRVGWQRARELTYTARTVRGPEALALGLACQVVPAAELDSAVAALCAQIRANSPQAIAASKDLYRATESVNLDDGLAYEAGAEYQIDDSHERLAEFLHRD